MKKTLKIIFLTLLLGLCTAPAPAQPIPQSGTHLIPRQPIPHRPAPKPPPGPAFKVGDQITIPAFNFQLIGFGQRYQTDITCRLVGQHSYIFVENDMWGTRVTQAGIDSLARAFDSATARYPDRGIYDVTTSLFGPPPNVDGDPRILIAIIDILDSPITGITIVGYFDTQNQAPPISREILYIDCRPLDITSTLARATLAHEFQHMIHWHADPTEEKWLDEACSEYAELACGYRDTTANDTALFMSLGANNSLTGWSDSPFDFDQSYLFMAYFVQRYGLSILRPLVADTAKGIASINRQLQTLGVPERFDHVFGQWAAALYLDGPGDLGFRDLTLAPAKRDTIALPTASLSRTAALWGADYLALPDAPGVALTLRSGGDNGLLITLIGGGEQPFAAPIAIAPGQIRRIHDFGNHPRALSLTSTSGSARGYTLSASALAIDSASPAASDFDGDGQIGFSDFLAFAGGFGKRTGDPGFDPTFDLNRDRSVDFSDFLIFVQNFGKTP